MAGTSAGSIVAALLAIGVRGSQLKEILQSPELFGLVDATDSARTERIRAAYLTVREILAPKADNKISAWKLWRFARCHPTLFDDLSTVWSSAGLHRSDKLREWLNTVLQGKTFDDIVVEDLKIVAADVTRKEYTVFDRENNKKKLIAEAVHASASIPLFFLPFKSGTDYLVDGGILSNFPSFLFAQGKYPTVGFRLVDFEPDDPVRGTFGYLGSLLATMVEAHDKQRGDPPYFKSFLIPTPPHISATKFNLSKSEANELYMAGLQVGKQVNWNAIATTHPIITHYEKNPQETLQFSMENASALFETYADPALWVEDLNSEVLFTAHIEHDWTTRYKIRNKIKVGGPRSLLMTRFKAMGSPQNARVQSIMDLDYTCEELLPNGTSRPLTRIPACNTQKVKGFVVFYVPPITEGPERVIQTGFSLPQELAKTVAKGFEDKLSYNVRQQAQCHNLTLKVQVCISVDLPPLNLVGGFGKKIAKCETRYEEGSGHTYHVHECELGPIVVAGVQNFEIYVSRA